MRSLPVKNVMWNETLIDHQDYDFVIRFSKRYKLVYNENLSVICRLGSNRKPHFESYKIFLDKYRCDISHNIYTNYCLRLMLYAKKEKESYQIIKYFAQETIRYKECISYYRYTSLIQDKKKVYRCLYKIKYVGYLIKFIFSVH